MRSIVTALAACSLLTLAALPAAADARLQFTGIGGHIGLVSPENLDSTFGLGVHADLGSLSDNVRLEGNLDYWKSSLQRWRRRCRACPDGLQGREPKL